MVLNNKNNKDLEIIEVIKNHKNTDVWLKFKDNEEYFSKIEVDDDYFLVEDIEKDLERLCKKYKEKGFSLSLDVVAIKINS